MPAQDPFDLVVRLRGMPLGVVVDALRRVHRGGAAPADLWSLLATGTPKAPAPPARQPPLALTAGTSTPPDYDRMRRHFVQHAQRLREQALLTERLLDRFGVGRTAPLQHELRIQCEAGRTAGARFLLVNSLDEPVVVTFRQGRVHGSSQETFPVHVTFDPASPSMRAGEEREIHVTVETQASIDDPNLDLGIDVLGNERLLIKLWLHLELQRRARK